MEILLVFMAMTAGVSLCEHSTKLLSQDIIHPWLLLNIVSNVIDHIFERARTIPRSHGEDSALLEGRLGL